MEEEVVVEEEIGVVSCILVTFEYLYVVEDCLYLT